MSRESAATQGLLLRDRMNAARFWSGLIISTVLALLLALPASGFDPTTTGGPDVSVIVRETPGAGNAPAQLVDGLGGDVGRRIDIIDGFVATVPEGAIERLSRSRTVHSVTRNARVQLQGLLDGWDHEDDYHSMLWVAEKTTGAGDFWNNGYRGQGVDVALIDSGVGAVNGFNTARKVLHGPDLTWESQAANLIHSDTFGHGTHMAGIIAGRDNGAPSAVEKGEDDHFVGIAPDARIVSVKVADAYGTTDVSQVLAAIDWVVNNRTANGMNIRVLNLSFGTDGTQAYTVDPLAYAVEVAWRNGIVVVVAAGNGGFGSAKLNNPAYDPRIIAVGGADGNGTNNWEDDTVQPWSSCGDGKRNVDLVAPGKSIPSLRVPGSYLDLANPQARVGTTPRFFRGSGTSQAAAVVSGAAALIISQRPTITPDQVKKLLKSTANNLPNVSTACEGSGMIDLKIARDTATPSASSSAQTAALATGTGLLELSRGSYHLRQNNVDLVGEKDIFGATFVSAVWAPASWAGNTWSGGNWNGNGWSGNTWSGNSWSGNTWSGNSWSGNSWSGNTWSGNTWSGNGWSGNGWSGNSWSGNSWSGNTWSGASWGS